MNAVITILLHSSKTMTVAPVTRQSTPSSPIYSEEAHELAAYLKALSSITIQKVMNVSGPMAQKTKQLIDSYEPDEAKARLLPAVDSFLGDIYSGLQVQLWSKADRAYAHEHLFILSGLYGVLRALDSIQPYRLEMGYKLPTDAPGGGSLYTFWGAKLADQLPKRGILLNLSAHEYTRAVLPYLKNNPDFKGVTVITPKFLTISPKTGQPTFVTVHAKIARGTFARWVIQHRVERADRFKEFSEIGYIYDATLSTEETPVYVAQTFEGLGLSVRLPK